MIHCKITGLVPGRGRGVSGDREPARLIFIFDSIAIRLECLQNTLLSQHYLTSGAEV